MKAMTSFRFALMRYLKGKKMLIMGKAEVKKMLVEGFQGSLEMKFDVQNRFAAAGFVVLQGVMRSKTKGEPMGKPGKILHYAIPFVAVLEFNPEGKLVRHQDYLDYVTAVKQTNSQ